MSLWTGEFRERKEEEEWKGKCVICKEVYPKEGKLCQKCRFKLKNRKIFEFFEEQLKKYNKKRGENKKNV